MMSWFSYFLLLFGLGWACVGLFRAYAEEKGMLDRPNDRSSHKIPTPRGGGVIFFVGWFLLLGFLRYIDYVSTEVAIYFLPVIIVGLIGFWDDHKGLSSETRFFFQILAAIAFLFLLSEGGMLVQDWLPWSIPLPLCFLFLVMGIVWFINLYNFMDGVDGFAATQAVFIFGISSYLLYTLQAYELSVLGVGLCALLVGFLTWNWPVARIFMGDCGSYFLGFLVIAYALLSHKYFNVPLSIWIILTGPFWFDATITLLRRIIARENWRQAHRSHAYQRMIQSGWSHQRVLLCLIALNAALGFLAVIAFFDHRLIPFSLGVTFSLLACTYIMVELAKPMFRRWN